MDLHDVVAESVQETQEDEVLAGADASSEAPAAPEGVEATPDEKVVPEATQDEPKGKNALDEPAKKVEAVEDEFAKKIGIPAESAPGRENRIPYSRVKKIVEKAEKDAEARLLKQFEDGNKPKFAEFETKVKDYEGRLEKVAQFEQILFNKPQEFLDILAGIPAYKQFFDFVRQAYASSVGMPTLAANQPVPVDPDAMPAPDQNGGYSAEQFQKVLDWQAKRVEKQIAERYAPIEERYKAEQKVQQLMPQIQAMVAEARTWPGFNENEAEITAALNADTSGKLTLEGAYRQVYIAKMQEAQAKIQEETRKATLEEVRRAGNSTSVPSRTTKQVPQATSGTRDLEDIIRESIAHLPR